jgi:LmbE family N-acetylglucosaminyl deacetylase
MKTILAIGAHEDDIEYSCGGSILYWISRGDKVIALILTGGERGGDPKIRRAECKRALEYLGVNKIIFGKFKDTRVPMDYNLINFIEKIITQYKPDMVLTHSEFDKHQDHRAVNWASKTAARNVHQVLMYESPSVLPEFRPQHYVDISDFMKKKMFALEMHKSQENKEYMDRKSIEGLSISRGRQIGARHAEAYEVMRYRHD